MKINDSIYIKAFYIIAIRIFPHRETDKVYSFFIIVYTEQGGQFTAFTDLTEEQAIQKAYALAQMAGIS